MDPRPNIPIHRDGIEAELPILPPDELGCSGMAKASLPIGTPVSFAYDLTRVSLSDPRETRSGIGTIIDNEDYSVWPASGYAVRVVESPNYAKGEVVHVTALSVRKIQ
jgi:hypothetical protein